ncbi:ABC transporter substrate-binding protein [Thermophilibacter mediterraneus]|uniref:ABC transporter substrate-binding protein n=1 Tax=Thermophilibacter mediterraneus TaxID=1871031 RepID=UPI000A7F1C39|nr:ABC transporter substrate-binding protein [Thermophilibacter mediterraneus]
MSKEQISGEMSRHGMTRRGFLGAVAATGATVAATGLAGCNGGGGTDDGGDASDGGQSAVELIEADEEGFVVRATNTDGKAPANECILAFEGEFQEMHPMDWSDGNSGNVVYYIYDSLYDLDENYELVPRAADSYEVSADACTYTFHLHEGITFTDGTPLDAAAVVANYEAAIDPANNWRRRRMFIESIDENTEETRVDSCTAVDDYTVEFHLPEPYAPFMNSVTQFYLISPAALADSSWDYSKQSAGSGPYVLEEYAQGDHVSIVRNEDYWGEAPSIDRVDFRVVPEAGSRIAALQTGEATAIYPMPTDQVATVRSAGDINMVSLESTTMRYVTLNTNYEPLSDVRVRQALNYALNQDEYVNVMYSGAATPATSVLPEMVPGYKAQTPYEYDLEKAKSLLEEAGYADGFEVSVICDNSTQETKGATFVMQQLEQIGVTVNVLPNEAATNAEIAAEPEDTTELQMWYVNWSQSDPDGFLRSLLSSAMVPPTGYNTAFWRNDEFDSELEAGNAAPTVEEQNEHYGKCQDIAWEECPWLYLASDNTLLSYKAYLNGIKYVPQGIDVIHATLNV